NRAAGIRAADGDGGKAKDGAACVPGGDGCAFCFTPVQSVSGAVVTQMSNFAFLKFEWPDLHESAVKVESLARTDARSCCFYARRTLELAIHWLYEHDPALKMPYDDNLDAHI